MLNYPSILYEIPINLEHFILVNVNTRIAKLLNC